MDLKTRRVEFAGLTTNPDAGWMKQTARHLTGTADGFLREKNDVLMDRDRKLCRGEFRDILESSETTPSLLPPRSPNLSAWMERFKSEALDRMISFSETSLRRAIAEYVKHYYSERNDQGLANDLIDPDDDVGAVAGKIECRERLGGVLNNYYRDAA